MIKTFKNDEEAYLKWVSDNPRGFVVNTDDPPTQAMYPMVHLSKHKVISSPARTNYTTDRYIKICGLNLAALESAIIERYDRPLTRCKKCFRES